MPFFFLLALVACTKKAAPVASEMTEAQLIERGAAIYKLNCIACHNPDPAIDGALGPAVVGSSLELLEERIMRAQYPKDYRPKKDTRQMVPMPHMQNEIPALKAFLNKGPGAYQ